MKLDLEQLLNTQHNLCDLIKKIGQTAEGPCS
jgi:hypothetical protein